MKPEPVVALATRHGKGTVITRALCPIGIAVHVLDSVDTDAFGTFSGERPREGTALEAARAKAQAALALGPWKAAVASEGSYGPHPLIPFLAWGEELVLYLDPKQSLEVVGRHLGPAPYAWQHRLPDRASMEAFRPPSMTPFIATTCLDGLPRPDLGVEKALTEQRLHAAWEKLDQGQGIWIQAELRAHLNSGRMAAVASAAEDLARRLARHCPSCDAPGFGEIAPLQGRPCRDCGAPTSLALARREACPACDHLLVHPVALKADPGHCPDCNP